MVVELGRRIGVQSDAWKVIVILGKGTPTMKS